MGNAETPLEVLGNLSQLKATIKEKMDRRNQDLVAKLREHGIYYDVQGLSSSQHLQQ